MPNTVLPAQILLHLAWLSAALAVVGAWRWHRSREGGRRLAAIGTLASAACLVWAFADLLAAFLRGDFRYALVAGYSDRALSTLYKVSATWAGAEGSFLLWTLLGGLLALTLLRRGPSADPLALAIFQTIQLGLLVVLVLRTPFQQLLPAPPDGRGLNPLLQDPWMATHPPVVFLGYAAAALPFALALSATLRGEARAWSAPALRWTLVTVLTLGVGILLGAFWAYEVLGWGGYWGWDPVENSSLIPWLVAVALLHGLLVQRRTGALARTNLAMALATFALVIYATFLTRSGVLASVSVHSFPESGALAPLLALLLAATLVPGAALAARWRRFHGEPLGLELELGTVLTVSLALLLLSATVILLGTSWPLITLAFGNPAALKPGFYVRTNLPVYVGVTALLVAAPLLAWRPIPLRRLATVSIVPAATGAVAAAAAVMAGLTAPLYLALMFFSGAAVGSCLVRAFRALRHSPLQVGAPVAHIGMALLFIGVLVSSVGESRQQVRLPLGETVDALGQPLRFDGRDPTASDRDRFRLVIDPRGAAAPATVELVPTMDGQVQRKPAIVRRLRGDLYLSPLGVERGERLARQVVLRKGETTQVEGQALRFERFTLGQHGEGMTVGAVLRLPGGETVEPSLRMGPAGQEDEPATLPGTGMRIALAGMHVEEQEVILAVTPPGMAQALVLETSWKPGMNLLWGGSLLLVAGTLVGWFRRLRVARQEALAGNEERAVPATPPAVGDARRLRVATAKPRRAARR